jgi:hypothetical protein
MKNGEGFTSLGHIPSGTRLESLRVECTPGGSYALRFTGQKRLASSKAGPYSITTWMPISGCVELDSTEEPKA